MACKNVTNIVLVALIACATIIAPAFGAPSQHNSNPAASHDHAEPVFSASIPETGVLPSQLILKGTGRPQPDEYTVISINPPTFSWPGIKGSNNYDIELSQAPDFINPRKISTTEQFYRPLSPLEDGQWWWRYRATDGKWMETSTFRITSDIHRWPIADWTTLMARIPGSRPRIYIRPEELSSYRKKASGTLKPVIDSWAKYIEKEEVGKKLPVENGHLSISNDETVTDPSIRKRRARLSVKSAANSLVGRVPDLCWLWMLTGNELFSREVHRRVLLATQLDPSGPTSFRSMDFANSTIVNGAAIAYDMLYDSFTEAERFTIRQMLVERTRPVIEHLLQVPKRILSPHGWQRLYLEAMIAALALHGDDDDADTWLEIGLKRFVSFYPWFGRQDGGSAEGINYFTSTGLVSSLRTADLFKAAFDLDFTQGNSWYRSNPLFLIYAYPPDSIMSRFGDISTSRYLKPPSSKEHFTALRMASLYNNHYIADYANRITDRNMRHMYFDLVRWMPFHDIEPASIDMLPKARAFNDIGVVYMHSDITHPNSDVRLEFRSSPYGGYGHAHADQNSFNIIAGNRPLIIDSGFYDKFGSPHHDDWTTQTKAHNTVLVDNIGQLRKKHHLTNAYGRLRLFHDDDDWAYVMGSAETAYRDINLERFDRHIIWLKGTDEQTYVVIDDLKSGDGKLHRFDWLLHSGQKFLIDENRKQVIAKNGSYEALIQFLGPEKVSFHQYAGFDIPPKNYRRSQILATKQQWHLTVSTKPVNEVTFNVVIRVSEKVDPTRPVGTLSASDTFVDGWIIRLIDQNISLLRAIDNN